MVLYGTMPDVYHKNKEYPTNNPSHYELLKNEFVIFVGRKLLNQKVMKAEDKSKLVEVFKGSLWEAELIKGLLEANGVKSVIKDGIVVNIALPETAIDVAVLVNEKDYEAAMQVMRERDKEQND